MASTGIQSAPSTSTSSSSPHRRKYDLFLSFRGKDTRYEFADTLFTTLKRWGIIVFRDNEGLHRGEEIDPSLEVAIKESRNAAIIVSPDFTKSKACLFELTVIMECWRMGRLSVFPVFYHIDPSDVGKLTKEFESHFNKLEDDPEDREVKWEYWKSLLDKIADWSIDPKLDEDLVESGGSALKKLSNISAWVVRENSYINPIIDQICRTIWTKTISDIPNISKNLVGIESRAANVMRLLELEKELKVHVVGICGMGGIGKSTLAEFIYKKVFPHFEAGHFSNPIGKVKDKEYLVRVQKTIIYDIFPEVAANLSNNAFRVKQVFQTILQERKVLIVLDDLWDTLQVEQLVGDLKWFGPGSRIIITSRIHDLLHLKKDKNIYEVEELNWDDASKLLCMKAFKQPHPKEGFEKLSNNIVYRAKGHPFALEIFGSYLSNKETKDRWYGYLKELGTKAEDNIVDTLRKSLEELDKGIISPEQVFPLKELFLDIACFFNGRRKSDVLDILEGVDDFGDNLAHNLSILVEKSLLKISDDQKLVMHDFLVDLGQQLAKSSRLVEKKDIICVLKNQPEVTKKNLEVKGIDATFSSQERETFHLEVLSAMVNLRILRLGYSGCIYDVVDWKGDCSKFKLSANLVEMKWNKYPFQSLPKDSNFALTKLVMLDLSFSSINRAWYEKKNFPKLRHIHLAACIGLIETPDVSQVPNLETLNLANCESLSMVHQSVGSLKRLRILSLDRCYELEQFPDVISSRCLEDLSFSSCRKLKKFPILPRSLPVLRHFNISQTNFEEHSFLSSEFPSLEIFEADAANMKELPSCIAFSKKLRSLSFSSPSYLATRLPTWFSNLSSLDTLSLRLCNFSDETEFIDLRGLSSLRSLNLEDNKFKKVPAIVGELSNLQFLSLDNSIYLEALSKLSLSLQNLQLRGCPSLEVFDSQMTEQISKEMLRASGCSFMVAYIGFEGKPYKILYLHPESPPHIDYTGSSSNFNDNVIRSAAACGPMLEPRITDWFIHRSSSSGKEIQIPMDWNSKSKPWVCAMLIVYEVYGHDKRECRKQKLDELENSDIGASEDSDSICPEFVCQLQLNEASPEHTFVVCVPEVACVGLYGLWVCINTNQNSSQEPEYVEQWSCRVSIIASSKKVVLKEGGARLLNRDAHLELVEVVRRLSQRGLDSRSLDLSLNNKLTLGPDLVDIKSIGPHELIRIDMARNYGPVIEKLKQKVVSLRLLGNLGS